MTKDEQCKLTCAWKGGSPCLADDCPRRHRPSKQRCFQIPVGTAHTDERVLCELLRQHGIRYWANDMAMETAHGITRPVYTVPPSETFELRPVPTGWIRGMKDTDTPNGPGEWNVDFSYGDDRPDGDGWVPLYSKPPHIRPAVEPATGERRSFTMKEAFGLATTAECPHGVQRDSCSVCIPEEPSPSLHQAGPNTVNGGR